MGAGAGSAHIVATAATATSIAKVLFIRTLPALAGDFAEWRPRIQPIAHATCAANTAKIKNLDSRLKNIKFICMSDVKTQDWQALSDLTRGRPIVVERVRLTDQGVAIEGAFELPRLAQLSAEDQVFVAAFVRSHGSIKEMEQVFGVSYPTIKARLNRIAGSLEFVEVDPEPGRAEVLDRLARGEITADQAVTELGGSR